MNSINLVIVILLFISLLAMSSTAGTWKDDFEEDGLDKMWEPDSAGRVEKVEWRIEDGQLLARMIDTLPPLWATFLKIGEANWMDYSLEVKVKLLEKIGGGWNGLGVGIRAQPQWANYYGIGLRFDTGEVGAYKIIGFDITYFFQDKLEFDEKWYKLKVVAEGKNISFYFNEQLLKSTLDSTFKSGFAHLWIANVHAYFDDVIITGPGIPDGGHWDIGKHEVNLKNKITTVWGKIKEEGEFK